MAFDRLCFATGGYMDIRRAGSQPSTKGPSDWFTGIVRIDPLFQAPDPAFVQGASVTFEPGARTAWHTEYNFKNRYVVVLLQFFLTSTLQTRISRADSFSKRTASARNSPLQCDGGGGNVADSGINRPYPRGRRNYRPAKIGRSSLRVLRNHAAAD